MRHIALAPLVLLAGAGCEIDLTGKDHCLNDADCLSGLACNRPVTGGEGICGPRTSDGRFQCKGDPDCLSTQICFDGLCATTCTAPASCLPGETCLIPAKQAAGLCGKGRLADPCLQASDCGAGQRCVAAKMPLGACKPDDGLAPAVLSFALVEAPSGKLLIDPLLPGQTIDLAQHPSVNVRAMTRPEPLGSVVFELDGQQRPGVENVAPYYFGANSLGTGVGAWLPGSGPHTIGATPHASMNATGRAGTSLWLNIVVNP